MLRASDHVSAAARSSAVAAFARRTRHEVRALTPSVRVRLAGIFVLTAVITEQLLRPLVPAQMRPVPGMTLRALITVASLALIVAAPHFARAWPTSSLRRLLPRASRPPAR